MALTEGQRQLVLAGAILFLLGLIQGAIVQFFANPRMALSAHLTAVQSSMAIMLAGIVWPSVSFQLGLEKSSRLAIISGMYGLWLGLTLSAATGASQSLPIAGAGHSANATIENLVSVIVLGSSGIMTLGWLGFVIGLIRSFRE